MGAETEKWVWSNVTSVWVHSTLSGGRTTLGLPYSTAPTMAAPVPQEREMKIKVAHTLTCSEVISFTICPKPCKIAQLCKDISQLNL